MSFPESRTMPFSLMLPNPEEPAWRQWLDNGLFETSPGRGRQ